MPGNRTVVLRAITAGALLAATAGCATTGGVPRPYPGRTPTSDRAPTAASGTSAEMAPTAARVVEVALLLQGAPYRDGGVDPSGFDCSGLVSYVFAQTGIQLPRTTREQYAAGRRVETGEIAAGDLLFFATSGSGPTHVAIAIDALRFIHAPNERTVVRVDSLETPYWSGRLIGVRRVL